MKRSRVVVAILTLALALSSAGIYTASALANPVKDEEAEKAKAERLKNVSENCSSIKQSLTQLQRADSRTRTYLGSAYETVAGTFITPLNLRLVKNNISDTRLLAIQTNFSSEQARFRSNFTNYMRELENLIRTDCAAEPETFYQTLESVRTLRAKLHDSTVILNKLVDEQHDAVTEFREKL